MSGPRFSIVPGDIIFDETLQARDLQVLLLLGRHTDNGGWCRRSQVRMAKELRCGRGTIQRALDRLVAAGWLEVRSVARAGEHEHASHYYRVCFEDRKAADAVEDKGQELADEGAHQRAGGVPTGEQGCPPMHGHITTPYNEEIEREQSIPDLGKLDRLRGRYPHASHADQDEVERHWRRLTPDERHDADEQFDAWLADKGPRTKIMGIVKYLAQKAWTRVTAAKPSAAKTEAGKRAIPPFDQPWWGLFHAFAEANAAELTRPDSAASRVLRQKVEFALNKAGFRTPMGWMVEASEIEAIEEKAKALVKVHRDGYAAAAWREHYAARGVAMPIPDQAQWIFMPSEWPPDSRQEEADLEAFAGTER